MFSSTPGGCPVVLAARAKLGHIGPLDEIVVKIRDLINVATLGKGTKRGSVTQDFLEVLT